MTVSQAYLNLCRHFVLKFQQDLSFLRNIGSVGRQERLTLDHQREQRRLHTFHCIIGFGLFVQQANDPPRATDRDPELFVIQRNRGIWLKSSRKEAYHQAQTGCDIQD